MHAFMSFDFVPLDCHLTGSHSVAHPEISAVSLSYNLTNVLSRVGKVYPRRFRCRPLSVPCFLTSISSLRL
jgi:hypothetical protein